MGRLVDPFMRRTPAPENICAGFAQLGTRDFSLTSAIRKRGQPEAKYPAVADDRFARSRQRKGVPKCDLVCGQDRTIEIFLQRIDDADGAEAVATDENCLGALGRLSKHPLIEFVRLNGLLVRRQPGGSGVNDLKALALKVAGALLVRL